MDRRTKWDPACWRQGIDLKLFPRAGAIKIGADWNALENAFTSYINALAFNRRGPLRTPIHINSEDGELARGLMFELLDHYLGLAPAHWPEALIAYKQQIITGGLRTLSAAAAKPAAVGPSLPIQGYAGTYADPWYGNIMVAKAATGLTIDFKSTPRMSGMLEHFQYDTFVTRFTDKAIEPAYVTFDLNADGHVDQVTMKPVSPIADFSWDYQDLLFRPVGTAP